MTTPIIALGRFLTGLLLGAALGLLYGFLRPLRKGLLRDLLFAPAVLWGYLYYGFAVCRGDFRMGYFAAFVLGAFLLDRTVGMWLRPIFGGFWKFAAKIARPVGKTIKNFWVFVKFLFATGKKWVTIKQKECTQKRCLRKGVRNERKKESLPSHTADIPSQYHPGQVRGAGGYRTVYGGADCPADFHSDGEGQAG